MLLGAVCISDDWDSEENKELMLAALRDFDSEHSSGEDGSELSSAPSSYPPAGTEYHIFGEMAAALEEVAIQKGHCFGRNTSNFYIKLENEKNTLEKFFPVEFKAGTPVINRGFFYCTTKDPHKVCAEKTLNDGKALSAKQHKKALCPVKIPFRFDGAKGCYILTQ